jgi:hypothetical protein
MAAATPTARDWDSQSLFADSTTAAAAAAAVGAALSTPGIFLPPLGGNGGVPGGPTGGGGGSPGATVEYLRDLVQKRIITLTYTRNVHDGCVSTCVAPPSPLLILFSPSRVPDGRIGSILS